METGYVFAVLHLIQDYKRALREICRATKHQLLGGDDKTLPPNVSFHHFLYAEKLKEKGVKPEASGKRGAWLRWRKPVRRILVGEQKKTFDGCEMVKYLAERYSSVTWDVSEETH